MTLSSCHDHDSHEPLHDSTIRFVAACHNFVYDWSWRRGFGLCPSPKLRRLGLPARFQSLRPVGRARAASTHELVPKCAWYTILHTRSCEVCPAGFKMATVRKLPPGTEKQVMKIRMATGRCNSPRSAVQGSWLASLKVKSSWARQFRSARGEKGACHVLPKQGSPQYLFKLRSMNPNVKKVDRYSDVWNLVSLFDQNQTKALDQREATSLAVEIEKNQSEECFGITSLLVATHL
jgi:hypothetical protein